MGESKFNSTVSSLFEGMDHVLTSKTVVGDAIHIGDAILVPLVDVSFAVAAGAFNDEKKDRGAGGMGGRISPCAVLIIQNGKTRLVNVRNYDTITKILDMIPDLLDRFEERKEGKKVTEKDIDDMLKEADKQ